MRNMLLMGLVAAMGASRAHAAEAKAGAPATPAAAARMAAPARPVALVDLNRATEEELISLPGIGPAKARAIAAYRKKTSFRRVEDLLKVRGIGRSIFKQVRDQVTVREAPAGAPSAAAPAKASPRPSVGTGASTR